MLNVSKTVYITSVFSILIRQHYVLIYNFDLRFVEICLVFLIFLKTGWDRSSPGSSPEPFFFSFSNHPFIRIDSDTFFILELFNEAWEFGYNNNNIEESGKDYHQVFDTDSSALCPH